MTALPRILFAGAALTALAACGERGDGVNQSQVVDAEPVSAEQAPRGDADHAGESVAGDGNESENGSAGSAASDAMRWNFSRAVGGLTLAFGEPATDNVRLMLRCEGAQVALHFMRPAEVVERRPSQVTVASGGMRWRTVVSVEESQLGGMSIQATTPLSSAPMTAFRSGEPLEVRWGEETIRVPGQVDGAVAEFFEACGN